jgi:hypothetical protein
MQRKMHLDSARALGVLTATPTDSAKAQEGTGRGGPRHPRASRIVIVRTLNYPPPPAMPDCSGIWCSGAA